GHLRLTLRLARLEKLDHARQTVRDVRSCHSTGVEGAHRELGAGLTDRLRRNDSYGVSEVGHSARRQCDSVAETAHTGLRLALEDGADRDRDVVLSLERLHNLGQLVARDDVVLAKQGAAALGCQLLRRTAADEVVVDDAAILVERHLYEAPGLAVLNAHDYVLRHVDETTCEVARV